MLAEIITIGDEILIGQIIDSNSAFIAQQLNKIGVSVYQITSVQDSKKHILKALQEAETHADIIILTGGLGPTKDDITKNTLAQYFNDTLVSNPEVLQNIQKIFSEHLNRPLLQVNIDQALVLSKAQVLPNIYGTAPGMCIEKLNKIFISLPGVPFEMKALIKNHVLPKIQAKYTLPYIIHKTILTTGIGESELANRIEQWENNLPKNIKLAYLPSLGKVRLRLSAKGENQQTVKNNVQEQIEKLLPQIADVFTGFQELNESLEETVAKQLTANKQTLATAESCTGGNIAKLLSAIPGASNYFNGSVVAYATTVKTSLLAVPQKLIDKHSVVSEQVAEAMAKNVKQLLKTNYAIATTGNAGPTKGDANAPIGTVCIAIATPNTVLSQKFNFGKNRKKVINRAVNKALEMLLKEISKN